MFTSVHVNRFLCRIKEKPQRNMTLTKKTVQSEEYVLCVAKIESIHGIRHLELTSISNGFRKLIFRNPLYLRHNNK